MAGGANCWITCGGSVRQPCPPLQLLLNLRDNLAALAVFTATLISPSGRAKRNAAMLVAFTPLSDLASGPSQRPPLDKEAHSALERDNRSHVCVTVFLRGCGLETGVYVGFGLEALKSDTVAAAHKTERGGCRRWPWLQNVVRRWRGGGVWSQRCELRVIGWPLKQSTAVEKVQWRCR